MLSWEEIHAYARTSGSLELNYQRLKVNHQDTYSFGQRLDIKVIDNLWVKNRLLVGVYLVRNQYSGQRRTTFRPRFSVDLSGHKYRAFYSLTPYKTNGFGGVATNHRVVQANFSVNPTDWPHLGLSYRHTHTFDDLRIREKDDLSRYWVLSSGWKHKSLNLRGSYRRQESINKLTSTKNSVVSAVTGGGKFNLGLPLKTLTSWDYDFSFTERKSLRVPVLKTPSHSFSTRWGGQPWSFLSWSANYQGKVVRTKRDGQVFKRYAHSFYGGVGISLTPKWDMSLNRGSTKSRADGRRSATDYLTVATNFKSSQVLKNLDATASLRRTYYIHTNVGKYALNLFYLSSRMRIYPEIEVRSDFTINYSDNPRARSRRYDVVKSVSVVTRPRSNLAVDFNYQTTTHGTRIAFLYSEIQSYRLDLTHWGKGNLSLRTSYQANLYEKRNIPNSYSFSGQISYPYRNLFSSSIVYLMRWTEDPHTGESLSSDNLSSQFNFSLGRRTKLTLTYYLTNLGKSISTGNLGLVLNQQF
jgi:hypothetical protein